MHFVLQCAASRLYATICSNNYMNRATFFFFCTKIALMQNIRFICNVIREYMLAICWTCDKLAQRQDNGDISVGMTCRTNTNTDTRHIYIFIPYICICVQGNISTVCICDVCVCVCGEKVLKKYIKHGYAHFCNSPKWNFNMPHCHISHSFINAMYTCQQQHAAAARCAIQHAPTKMG